MPHHLLLKHIKRGTGEVAVGERSPAIVNEPADSAEASSAASPRFVSVHCPVDTHRGLHRLAHGMLFFFSASRLGSILQEQVPILGVESAVAFNVVTYNQGIAWRDLTRRVLA